MHALRRHLFPIIGLALLILALLLAVGEPYAADLVVSDATFRIDGEAVPAYLPTDPCRDFVQLHGTLVVFTKVELGPTTRAIDHVWVYTTLHVVGTGATQAYSAIGAIAASEVCATIDPCYVGFRAESQLFQTGSCPMTMVLVTGGLFFRPDGSLADGSLPDDPICALNDPVGVTCSGFRFAPVPYLVAERWDSLGRADP